MYYGWNIVAVGIVFQAIAIGMTAFVFTFWAQSWTEEFGSDRTQVTAAFMLFTLAMGAVSPFLGRILDKYSIRWLIITGAAMLATGFILISVATAMWQITLLYTTIIATGAVLSGPLTAQTLTAKWFRARRGLAIGWGSIGTSVGGLVLPPVVIYLVLHLGWREAHQVLAVASFLIIAPLAWKIVRNSPEDYGIEPELEGKFDVPETVGTEVRGWTSARLFRTRNFWIPIAAFLPSMAATSTVQANLRFYTADLGINAQSTATLMSIFAGTMLLGKLFFGGLADRVDQRLLYWGATSMMVVCMGLLIGRPDYPLMVFICSLLGFAAGGFLPLLGAIVGGRFGGRAYGQVLGLMGMFLTLSAFAPTLGSWIRDTTGSFDVIFEILVVVLVLAMLSMVFLKKQSRMEP